MQVLDNYSKTVFRNDNQFGTFYSIGLSKKDRNNQYINGYMNCRFRKGVNVPNMTKIYIKNAFIDFYLDKNNRTVPYIMITEYELAEQKENKKEEFDPYSYFGNSVEVKEDSLELPF